MKRVLFTALFVLGSLAYGGKQGEITVPSAVEVSPRDAITMFDIVETKSVPENVLSELRKIEIADGSTKTIPKIELIKKLKTIETYFLLPPEVKLLRSKNAVSRMEIERKIRNHLLMNCVNCEFQIQINSVPQAISADWEMDLNIDLNKTSVMIPIYSAAQSDNKGWVVASIKRYAQTAVLNRAIKIGEIINEDSLVVEKRLILNANEVVTDVKNIIGMQAARFLNAGQTLSFRDLKKEAVLKKGQMVKAIFGQNNFEVSITAQAEEGGAIGDVVKVKNMDSQKMFAAKIVDRGLVQIE